MTARNSTDVHPAAAPTGAALPPLELDERGAPFADEGVYRDLFEHTGYILVATDLRGRFLSANEEFQVRLGYAPAEARQLTWKKLLPSYELARARQIFKRHTRGEKRIKFELDTIASNGAIVSLEIDSRPMFRDGRLAGFHGIARDITERNRIQQDLIRARQAVTRGRRDQSTLLADMNREIRAPIGDMLRFLSLVGKTALTGQQRQYLETIESSAVRLLKIFNDLYGRSWMAPESLPIVDATAKPRCFNGEAMRALVVDDNAVNRRFLCALLERYRMATHQADGGTAAVIACRDRSYDLVMMDIQMADMDGFDTTRRIRRLPGWRTCPIIAVSATEVRDGREFLEAGFDEFLAKPVDERRLIELLLRYFPVGAAPGQ